MPCRAARCPRAAARLLQPPPAPSSHIWISDDLLAQTFARFSLRVDSSCRRHGSNVPGPLEARKRSAKRRMVGLAHHAGPSMPDFGSLFGTGPVNVGGLWKPPASAPVAAAAPSVVYSPQGQEMRETAWRFTKKGRRPAKKAEVLTTEQCISAVKHCTSLEDIVQAHSALCPRGDLPVAFSKAAFKRLLDIAAAREEQAGCLHDEHLADIVDFLQQDLNHDAAWNVHAYYTWLKARAATPSALKGFVDILCDKITLANIPGEEVDSVVRNLSPSLHVVSQYQWQHDELLVDLYGCISTAIHAKLPTYNAPRRHEACAALFEGLCKLAPSDPAALLTLRTLRLLEAAQDSQPLPDTTVVANYISQWLLHLSSLDTADDKNADTPQHPLYDLLNFLDSHCPSHHAESIVTTATAHFVRDLPEHHTFAGSVVLQWLQLLRQSKLLRDKTWDSPVWSHLYSTLSTRFCLADLHAHFADLGAVDSVRVIIHHWIRHFLIHNELPRIKALAPPSTNISHVTVSYTLGHVRSTGKKEELMATIDPDQVIEGMQLTYEDRVARYPAGHPPIVAPYIDLVSSLNDDTLPFKRRDRAIDDIVELLIYHKTPQQLMTVILSLRRHEVYVPTSAALRLIKFMIDTDNLGYALQIFHACPTAWLSFCPELIFALVERRPFNTIDLFRLLNRAEYCNSLPISMRISPTNTLSEQRLELIYHLVYAVSKSPHLTSRQAFRAITDFMRYLQSRNAPLSSLVSRALVHAGVIRPLQEGHWVSTVKFAWILTFVREFEGDDVADKIDRIAFQWRSDNFAAEPLEDRLERLAREKDAKALQYRRAIGHYSSRWKRRTRQWKSWLSDNKRW